jgi:hypothetical protein
MTKYEYIGACIDDTELYRYSLLRIWNSVKPHVVFIMLNPSTADASRDDATIKKCCRLADKWGYGGIVVVNLFGFRSSNPKALLTAGDPVGPENDRYIRDAVASSALIIAAWGNHGKIKNRDEQVTKLISDKYNLYCLAVNQNGSPKHPLYVKDTTLPIMYRSQNYEI